MLGAIRRAGSIEVGSPRVPLSGAAAGACLAALVTVSTIGYGLTTGDVENVWILPDELDYGLLARSFGSTGHFAIRGVDTLAYPVGYPFTIAAAFVGRGPVAAYEAAKWINALLMSLAAIPTYLIARRLLTRWLSLLAAALTLLIPSFAYTGVLLSENAFFPAVLLCLLAIVRALEQPTAARQLVAVASIVPAVAVRAEGLVLAPVLLCAIALTALADCDRTRGLRSSALLRELDRFRVTWAMAPISVAIVWGGTALAGRSPGALLGRYSGSLATYPVLRTLRWAVYQLVDLELYLGVLPFVPAAVVAGTLLRGSGVSRPRRAVAATGTAASALFVLAAAAASQGNQGGSFNYPALPPELHDRYCFFVAPLFLIGFLDWLRRRRELSNRMLIPLVAGAAVLPLVLPYATVHSNAEFDAFALLPWSSSLIADRNVHYGMAVAAAVLGATLIPRRPSIALFQVAIVGFLLWFVGGLARENIAAASVEVPTSHPDNRSWIDRALPPGERAAVVWSPPATWSLARSLRREQALWRAELLNESVGPTFTVGRAMHYDLPATSARLLGGRLIAPGGYRYLLVASPVPVVGSVVARDRRAGLTLIRLPAPTSG